MASREPAQRVVRNVAWLGGVLVAVALSMGYISVEFSPLWGAVAFTVTVGLSYALVGNNDEISISWALSAVALGLIIIEFVLPDWVAGSVATDTLTWPPDPLKFAVLAAALIAGWWIVDIRFISRSGVKPNTVAKRFRSRLERWAEGWFAILAIGFGALIITVVLFFNTFLGPVIGEIASVAAEAPYVFADVATVGLGYLALGGNIPILSDLPFLSSIQAQGFLVLSIVILAVASGVRFADD